MTAAVASVVGRSSFRAIRRDGRRFQQGALRLIFRSHDGDARVAFALGRAFGSAVDRNRARRRLREAFRQMSRPMPQGDYLFVCPPSVLSLTFSEIQHQLGEIAAEVEDLELKSRVTQDRGPA